MPKLCEASEPWPINECFKIIQMTENHSNVPKISRYYTQLRNATHVWGVLKYPAQVGLGFFYPEGLTLLSRKLWLRWRLGWMAICLTGVPGIYQGLVWMVRTPFGTSLGNTLRIIAWCDRGGGKKRCILGVNFIGFSVFYISTHVFISTHV